MNEDIFETPSSTPNFQTELAAQLADLVPEAIADGKIDVLKLQELLAQDAAETSERYGLFWPGKQRALRVAQMPTSATLKPEPEKSKDWDTTKNIFIEGDNLEVLKILQKHYHGKIKMIYIDPPYNTGKDFVYPDNFKEGLDNYLEWTRQVNEDGVKVSTNSETVGRYHSNWLNMMYPRLKLARNLLADDGSIFISIDDNEIDNLLKLCKEVFGESNHLATFIWKSKAGGANDSGEVAVDHEYVVAFAKKADGSILGLDPDAVATTNYNLADERGKYALRRLDQQNLQYSKSMDYELVGPGGEIFKLEHKDPARPNAIWRWSKEKVAKDMDQLVFKDGHVYTKFYEQPGGKPRSLLIEERFGRTRTGSSELRKLLGGDFFDNPKPVRLIKSLVSIATDKNSIILDFFAGSATTANAVMELNSDDGGSRRFIQVQLPEPTVQDSDARNAGFNSIADISRRRIELAAEELKEEASQKLALGHLVSDFGFRSYRLAESAFLKWRVTNDTDMTTLEQHLFSLRGSADDGARAEDLLTEVLLKQGYSLTEEITAVQISGFEFLSIGEGLILAYLHELKKPTLELLREAVAYEPSKLIILEDAFQGDDELKTNLAQLCKSNNIEFWTA